MNITNRKIFCLLVEDDQGDIYEIVGSLEDISKNMIEFRIARNLEQCGRILDIYNPDVILMDLLLPDSDVQNTYYTVARKAYPKPVIMLTGCPRIIYQKAYLEKNENLFCKKDLDYAKLWKRILQVLENAGSSFGSSNQKEQYA